MILINWLYQRLGVSRAPDNASHAGCISDLKATEETLHTALPDHLRTLQQLVQERHLLEVRIHGRESSHQSMLLAVDIERGLLWLDQLAPGCAPLSDGNWLTITHHSHTEQLQLVLPVVTDQTAGRGAIALLIPEKAEYRPRRRWQRFEFPGQILRANVRAVGEEPTLAKVLNISAGGLRLALQGNQLRHYRRDALLPLCSLALSQSIKINCQARVKSARLVREPYRHTQVSLEFCNTKLPATLLEEKLAALRPILPPERTHAA